ncbi:MAG: alpha/beta hydrolase family protein [Terriglobia bacterium]
MKRTGLRPGRFVWVFLLLLAVSGGVRAQDTTGYQPEDGPYALQEVEELVLHDAARGKDLPLRIHYPEEGGPYPVIVFSHGAGGSKECCAALMRHWASHGYVVIQVTHADSLRLRRQRGERVAIGRALGEAIRGLLDPEVRRERTGDISFVLDSLGEIEARLPEVAGKIDAERIGVAGHSAGALTAMLLGGTRSFADGAHDHTDPRPRAFLLLSAQGHGTGLGFTEESWQDFTRPMMNMTGSRDLAVGGQGPEWRKDPFEFAPPGDKYHVYIEGAHHGSFIGNLRGGAAAWLRGETLQGEALKEQEAIFVWVKVACLAFWDAYLKDDREASDYLASDALPRLSAGGVLLLRK